MLLESQMDRKMRVQVQRVLLVLLLGELFGLHTLNQVLHQQGIGSNKLQKIWQKLSCGQLVGLLNGLMWAAFEQPFRAICDKSSSTQSRGVLTLVLDGSIFRQWLSAGGGCKFYDKYFSGQTRCTVYGFNMLLGGMTMDGVFYPLHFHIRRKSQNDSQVAIGMLKRIRVQLEKRLPRGQSLPSLYASVDSGFTTPPLLAACQNMGITCIGVPKSNQVVYVEGQKYKVGELLKEYLRHEQGQQTAHFTWRIRVRHQASKQEVALLFFRLQASAKVSVILTPDIHCKGKTLRRHWFERTRIEQFFRTIKHDLCIQQARSKDYLGFVRKIALFLFKALFVNLLTRHCQRRLKQPRKMGFAKIRNLIIYHQMEQHLLHQALQGIPFAKIKIENN